MSNKQRAAASAWFGEREAAQLRRRCEMTIGEIIAEVAGRGACEVEQTPDGPLVWSTAAGGGSGVLGVVHMDFVPVPHKWRYKPSRGEVWTPRLDDRLGLWVLLDWLPSRGINLDLLLTDSEEVGRSTAGYFGPSSHGYGWLAQFDRRGDDVVLYDYDECDEWRGALSSHGFKVGQGSFSDISNLTGLGVCGVNVGVGYHHEHSTSCYGDLVQLGHNLALFESFYGSHSGRRWDYAPPARPSWSGWCDRGADVGYGHAGWRDDELAPPVFDAECLICGMPCSRWEFDGCSVCEAELSPAEFRACRDEAFDMWCELNPESREGGDDVLFS
jgi:hypothetical protein